MKPTARSPHTQLVRAPGILAWCLTLLLGCLFTQDLRADDEIGRLAAEGAKAAPAITLSPSGRYVSKADPDGSVWLVNPLSGRKRLAAETGSAAAIVWTPDSRFLMVAGPGSASIYQVPAGRLAAQLRGGGFNQLPRMAPDGRKFAFVREHNLWLATMDGKSQRPLTTEGNADRLAGEADPLYAHEFDAETHSWWSPDSKCIAFIETEFAGSNHYPVAGGKLPTFRLKVVDVESSQVRTLAESSEEWPYLLRVVWHPDGRHLAAYRMNRLQTTAELTLYSTPNAEARTVLTEKDAYWVNAPETPLFLQRGEQIVVSSERSGHRHVYLYNTDGALIRDLTPAGMEVYRLHPSIDAAGGVFIDASTGDNQQQYLFRMDTGRVKATQITKQAGWHEAIEDPAGTANIDRYSSVSEAPSVTWHGPGGQQREMVKAASSESAVASDSMSIMMHDGIGLPARLFKPRDFDLHKRYPLIVYTYSGPRGRAVEDAWGGWQMAWNRYMVHKGYLVLAVDTRGAAGYGHLFEEYLHIRLGAQETADLREVIDYLRQQPFVDRQRLGIWGCDYGAHIALHAIMEIPNGFKAGFADSPILVWSDYNAYFVERYLGLPGGHVHEYDDSSPLDSARNMTGEVLIASGAANPVIRADQLEALDTVLKRPKSRKIAKQVHRVNFADSNYRTNRIELETLLEAMTQFFIHSL